LEVGGTHSLLEHQEKEKGEQRLEAGRGVGARRLPGQDEGHKHIEKGIRGEGASQKVNWEKKGTEGGRIQDLCPTLKVSENRKPRP